ncbi:response regulator transcription factor [Modestobacter sp. SYSU DS0511]
MDRVERADRGVAELLDAGAVDGRAAVEVARRLRPDVCLLDIRMPGTDGLEATRLLTGPGVDDPIPVVVITTFDLDEYVYAALRAGARGSCSRTQVRTCSPKPCTPPLAATP